MLPCKKYKQVHRFYSKALIALALSWFFTLPSIAQQNADTFQSIPIFSSSRAQPTIMLTLGTDHQLFLKAYPDFNDLYDQAFNPLELYEGYFDPKFCYQYDTAKSVFVPSSTQLLIDANGFCPVADWSGRFMNWASMTRFPGQANAKVHFLFPADSSDCSSMLARDRRRTNGSGFAGTG